MKGSSVFVLIFIVCTSSITSSAVGRYHQEDDDNNENHLFKRIFFHKTMKSSSTHSPSVIDNLVHSTSSYVTSKSTYSPYYSSGVCSPNPCEHDGICTPKGQMTYECKCVGPWRGIHCNIVDTCYRSPCQNGATCFNFQDDYWCKCTNDYYGTNCQTKYSNTNNTENNCRSNICNTGRCISLKATYYCQCPDDRYGEHCEKRLNQQNISKRQTLSQLLDQLRRGRHHKYDYGNPDDGRAYYDYKNGIYF